MTIRLVCEEPSKGFLRRALSLSIRGLYEEGSMRRALFLQIEGLYEEEGSISIYRRAL